MKVLTKKQIIWIVVAAVCTAIFVYWFVFILQDLIEVFQIAIANSEYIFALSQTFSIFLDFALTYGLIMRLVVKFFIIKKNMPSLPSSKLSKKQMLQIAFAALCTALTAFATWAVINGIFTSLLPMIKMIQHDYPNNLNAIRSLTNGIIQNSLALATLLAFYAFYLTLSIIVFKQEYKKARNYISPPPPPING